MALRKDTAYEEQGKFIGWVFWTLVWSFLTLVGLMLLMMPLQSWLKEGLSVITFGQAVDFWKQALSKGSYLIETYVRWYKAFAASSHPHYTMYLPFIPFIATIGVFIFGLMTNPHEYMPKVFGGGRLAELADIKKMKLFDGFAIVLGRFKGKLLKMPETLSALVVAPPGTGKTVAVVIPTILESPGMSLIVNDPKPELCYKTSGYRATEGPVFVINWGAEDDPSKGIYYPSWNALSASCLPPLGPARDLYIDSMVAVLVEDPKGGADPHWSKTGRNAMAGFLHFISSKCERARANDYFYSKLVDGSFDKEDAEVLTTYYLDMADNSARLALDALKRGELTLDNYAPIGTWDGIPENWHGNEPCVAMILDWLTDTQMKISADLKRRSNEGDQMAMMADPMRDLLDLAVNECHRFGYARRAIVEMNQLAGTPDKERGSILSTALTGINIFKNAAVRARTKFSDITFRDLRGMRDPITGEMKPITVYLSVNQVDARALNVITGIFVELMSSFLIANPPDFVGSDGTKAGPYSVIFVLDEFPQMPKLTAVKDGPAVGRGQKVSYLLIGQDLGQISGQYGKDDLETIITTTAAKVILAQNNEQTAERFSKMIGSKTIEVASSSRTEGFSQQANPFAANISRSLQSSNVVGASSMMSLDIMKQYVLYQGFLNRPILADSPRWYLDKGMRKKCAIPPSPFVPYWIVAQREEVDVDALKSMVKGNLLELEELEG
ncbi:MAG: type IV secretory system conjugative DNA transfer family protein [Lactobacillales bacterium]|jgi:type IV secretion system protein VirD4|nr:type IV secretory system conjugative DNA transfer family protein [Lactobacillales bacterium]